MLPRTSYSVLLVLVLTSLALTGNTVRAEDKSEAEYSTQKTLQCVLNKGLTSDNCTEAVRVRYSDVEFPDLLCGSLHIFFPIYKLVGCKKDDIVTLAGIFCKKNLTCTPDVKSEITTQTIQTVTKPTNQNATTDSPKETEHSSTLKPAPITESLPDKPKDLTGNAACVVEMLSSNNCKRILRLKLKKNKNLLSVCKWLKSSQIEIYNCSVSDKDKLGKVLCDNVAVTCPPEAEVSDSAQLVNLLIKDFAELCKVTVRTMIDDFVKNKEETCATIDDDLSDLCKEEEITNLKDVVCTDLKKP